MQGLRTLREYVRRARVWLAMIEATAEEGAAAEQQQGGVEQGAEVKEVDNGHKGEGGEDKEEEDKEEEKKSLMDQNEDGTHKHSDGKEAEAIDKQTYVFHSQQLCMCAWLCVCVCMCVCGCQ